jgi:hypothetical protein
LKTPACQLIKGKSPEATKDPSALRHIAILEEFLQTEPTAQPNLSVAHETDARGLASPRVTY